MVDSGFGYFQVLDEYGIPRVRLPVRHPRGTRRLQRVRAAVDANGNIYAASFNEGVVDVFTPRPGFNPLCDFGLPVCYTLTSQIGATAPGGKLSGPYGVALSGSTLYVTQSTKNSVSAFGLDGTYLGSWGTKGAANGQFNRPLGIATDSAGNIYVDDYGNSRVSVLQPLTCVEPDGRMPPIRPVCVDVRCQCFADGISTDARRSSGWLTTSSRG